MQEYFEEHVVIPIVRYCALLLARGDSCAS